MNYDTTPIITFAARSGTGKTTFLERLIPELKARGLRLAVIKHDVHGFEIDHPGKDTYRFTAAGADIVAIANREKQAVICRLDREPTLREIVEGLPEADLVLTEGYKRSGQPRIEIHRAALGRELLSDPAELLLILTDEPLPVETPQLPLSDVKGCADFILRYVAEFPGA